MSTPEDVLAYYATGVEGDRLARGAGALELARTQELLARFLPQRAGVADVGGGTGVYAEWLAGAGHRVELVDPVPLHVERARERAGDPPRFGVHRADARSLPFDDGAFDAVLLLGPLYHLGERDDRLRALREAARVCRSGGIVCAAAISRYAPLLFAAIVSARIDEDGLFANVWDETTTGRRIPPERRNSPFPDGYFHRPEELEDELRTAGFDVDGVYGIEGPGVLTTELERLWQDDVARERLLEVARLTEREPHLLAVSAHLLGVGRKP